MLQYRDMDRIMRYCLVHEILMGIEAMVVLGDYELCVGARLSHCFCNVSMKETNSAAGRGE